MAQANKEIYSDKQRKDVTKKRSSTKNAERVGWATANKQASGVAAKAKLKSSHTKRMSH